MYTVATGAVSYDFRTEPGGESVIAVFIATDALARDSKLLS